VSGALWVIEEGSIANKLPIKASVIRVIDLFRHLTVEHRADGVAGRTEIEFQHWRRLDEAGQDDHGLKNTHWSSRARFPMRAAEIAICDNRTSKDIYQYISMPCFSAELPLKSAKSR
jgi:hypothetical protein